MLTQEQNREYRRSKQLNEFFNANTTAYESFAPFKAEVAEFKDNLAALEKAVPDKDTISTDITTNKTDLKQQVADLLGIICRKSYAYALKYNNPQLAAVVNTRGDIIFKNKDGNILAFANSINNTLQPLLADDNFIQYGVTDKDLSTALALATRFNSFIGKAAEDASGNTVANTNINNAIAKLRGNIRQFDLLIDNFTYSNPNFVQGYHINSEVDNAGIRHSGVEGFVKDKNGAAIEGATVKLLGTTKQSVSDLMGKYHIDRAMPDDYQVECSAAGFKTATKLLHISRGKTSEADWVLEEA